MLSNKNKIDELTKMKNDYKKKLDSYNKSLNYANKLLSILKSSNQQLLNTNDGLHAYFNINGKTLDGGKVKELKDRVTNIINKMENTIIPGIKSNIDTLNKKIKDTEKQITDLIRGNRNIEVN